MSLPIIDFSSPNRLATAKVLTEAMETVGFVYLDNVPGFNKEDILCTEQEIFNLLIALDTSKASGPDGISGKKAQRNCYIYCTSPNRAFQSIDLSLTCGRIPSKWHGNCHLLSQSLSHQVMQTIPQIKGQ